MRYHEDSLSMIWYNPYNYDSISNIIQFYLELHPQVWLQEMVVIRHKLGIFSHHVVNWRQLGILLIIMLRDHIADLI